MLTRLNCGNHFIVQEDTESCYTPETIIMLYVNYITIKKIVGDFFYSPILTNQVGKR